MHNNNSPIKISIIVSTWNTGDKIISTLDSFRQAILSLKEARGVNGEVVIVDNNSSDFLTSSMIQKWCQDNADVAPKFLTEKRKGVCYARNAGAEAARGEILVFTDHDCQLDKHHLVQAVDHVESDSVDVLRAGRLELGDPTDLPLTVQTTPHTIRWEKSQNTTAHTHLGGGALVGCNFVLKKKLFEALGGFDTHLGPGSWLPAGEDTDLVFRAYRKNVPIEYVPDMAVYHFHGRKTAEQARATIKSYILSSGALYAKHNFFHPDLKRKIRVLAKKVQSKILPHKDEKVVFFHHGNDVLAKVDYSAKQKLVFLAQGAGLYFKSLLLKRR